MLIKRDKKNLTQSELAKLSNVNRTTIAKLESFQRLVVNLDVILRLLDALDLKLTISDKMSDLLKSIWSKNRQDIAVGRCIRAIMRKTEDSFTDKEYEVFVNLFKSEIDKLNNKFSYFDIVRK